MKRFALYLIRWQLSTPLLYACMAALLDRTGALGATIISNLIGGAVFFWIDRAIFRKGRKNDYLYKRP